MSILFDCLDLLITFFLIGLFTIGGGYAMIPMITQRVTERGWLTMPQLIDFIAVGESTPGPFAVNIATFVGMEIQGVIGAMFSTFGIVLPSFIIIVLISRFFYDRFVGNFYVQGVLSGIRPAVLGLVGSAVLTVLLSVLFGQEHFPASFSEAVSGISLSSVVILVILVAFKFLNKKAHPIFLTIAAAALGIVINGFLM